MWHQLQIDAAGYAQSMAAANVVQWITLAKALERFAIGQRRAL